MQKEKTLELYEKIFADIQMTRLINGQGNKEEELKLLLPFLESELAIRIADLQLETKFEGK